MKKLLTIIVLLFPFFVWSQNYIPIPADSTSEWRVKKTYHFKGDICLQVDDINYYFIGDTLINNLTYSKIYKYGIHYQVPLGPNSNCDPNVNHFTDVYVGAIRNDTGKVFFKSIYNNPEILLYDFTLNIGDTLKRPCFGSTTDTNIVVAIDTVTINNRQHRRFFISDGSQSSGTIDSTNYIVEGIGAAIGLVEEPNWEGANELLCYAENHIPIFPFGCSCILNVGVEEIGNNQNASIQLYPNPTKDIITLEFHDRVYKDLYLSIYDLMGRRVKQFKIPNKKLKYNFNLSRFETGLYFYKINNETKIIYSGKIIKE